MINSIKEVAWRGKKEIKKYSHEVQKAVYGGVFDRWKKEAEAEGSEEVFFDVMRKYLESSNVKPIYEQEKNNPEIEQMRERLNTEPGLIISNHPGHFDSAVIMNLLHRPDFKIMVSSRNYSAFVEAFGPEMFMEAAHTDASLLKKVKKHIEAGGALMIFPTAGSDSIKNRVAGVDQKIEFEGGLDSMVRRCLRPEDMIYSFYVEPDDIASLVKEAIPRGMGSVAQGVLGKKGNIDQLKNTGTIRVDEKYSQAQDWKGLVETGGSRQENSEALAQHYLEQFKI